MGMAHSQSETDIILLAIAEEKAAFAHLAAAAQASTSPKARCLYNQLALDEVKHLLTLVSLLESLADDGLAELNLTLPTPEAPGPGPQTEDSLLRSTMAGEERSRDFFSRLARGVDREELLAVLESLRGEEQEHLMRLRSMLYGVEADRSVVAKWLRSIRRLIPAAHLQ